MRIKFRHDMVLAYPALAKSLIMVLRLTPRSHEGQHVADWRIDLDVDCRLAASEDAFGNIVHTINAEGPLQEVGMLIEGEVETHDAAGIVRGAVERFPPPLYLRETPLTTADAALRGFTARVAAENTGTLDVLHGLMKEVHAALAVEPDAPAECTAAEALAAKRGTSRDFAHVFIACARHLDIPARYTSGFCMIGGDEARAHGWAEAFVTDIGWIGFDPLHDICPQEAHIRIACGLDGLGAAPVRAARAGTFGEAPSVIVRDSRGQSQSQKQL